MRKNQSTCNSSFSRLDSEQCGEVDSQCGECADPLTVRCDTNTWCKVFAFPGVDKEAIRRLRRGVHEALFPWDATYNDARLVWNKSINNFPTVIAKVSSAEEVCFAMEWARKHGMKVTVRAGGHSNEGSCIGVEMVVDLTLMNGIEVVEGGKYVWLDAGCLLGPVAKFLADRHGLMIAAGSCPNVGVAGLCLGGGMGYSVRRYGLTSDNLVAVQAVLPPTDACDKARVMKAKGGDPLLWVCRGAGGGNGGCIVTRFKFRAHRLSDEGVTLIEGFWDWREAERMVRGWMAWACVEADRRMTLALQLLGPKRGVRVVGQFLGPKSQAKECFRGWVGGYSIPRPKKILVKGCSFLDVARYIAGPNHHAPCQRAKAYFVREGRLDTQALVRLAEGLEEDAPTCESISLNPLAGAVWDVGEHETSWCWRKGYPAWLCATVNWTNAEDQRRKEDKLKGLCCKLEGRVLGGKPHVYINFPDKEVISVERYWGKHADRILEIRTKNDPLGLICGGVVSKGKRQHE